MTADLPREPAPEGSSFRKEARSVLFTRAVQAYRQGASFMTFVEREDPELVGLVTEKDLNAIFYLIWKGKFVVKPEGRKSR